MKNDPNASEYLKALQSALAGTEGITEQFMYDGEKQIIFYSNIPGTDGWTMAVRVPVSDYMGNYNRAAKTTVIFIVAFIVVGVAISIIMSIRIANPIIAITRRLEQLSEGDLTTSVPKIKSKNELGVLSQTLTTTVQSLNAYIRNIGAVLSAISDGDFTHEININYKGDFIALRESLEHILSELNMMFTSIKYSAAEVATASSEISGAAQQLANGSSQQASSVERLSMVISEISKQTDHNAEIAEKASTLSMQIKTDAECGGEQMQNMIEAVKAINQASQDISKIISVIDNIAFQTNILALNAAVEAARAGQYGKGFAVVAEEVRNLAAKSAEAAKDTEALISNSMEKAELGWKIAEETSTSLNSIVTGVIDSSAIISEITASSIEQAEKIADINSQIDQVSTVVQNNSATSQESTASSEKMSVQASDLQNMVDKFKLKRI